MNQPDIVIRRGLPRVKTEADHFNADTGFQMFPED